MTSPTYKKNNYFLRSVVSHKLMNSEIKEICLLKEKHWKFGLNAQLKWFNNNVKKYDLHNLFYIKSKLVGYTLLRKRTVIIESSNKKTKYLLFDTLIIDKKFRNMKLSYLLMNFNNLVITLSKMPSFLMCDKKLINFYKKNNWKILNKKIFCVSDYKFTTKGMTFNKFDFDKKYTFYINR